LTEGLTVFALKDGILISIMGIGVGHRRLPAPDTAREASTWCKLDHASCLFARTCLHARYDPKDYCVLPCRGTQVAENPTVARKCEPIDALHTMRGPSLMPRARRASTMVKSFDIVPPHVQVVVEGNQIWRGMRRRQDKDSQPSHHIPILQRKICPPLSEFTTRDVP
jgi:hypothetical protein